MAPPTTFNMNNSLFITSLDGITDTMVEKIVIDNPDNDTTHTAILLFLKKTNNPSCSGLFLVCHNKARNI